jgi:hypothetical protein
MKDGRVVDVKITKISADFVEFQKPGMSKIFKVSKEKIDKIDKVEENQKAQKESSQIESVAQDTIVLKDGTKIHGVIIGENDSNYIIKSQNENKIIHVSKQNVTSQVQTSKSEAVSAPPIVPRTTTQVEKSEIAKFTLTDGSVIDAVVLGESSEKFIVKQQSNGQVLFIPKNSIKDHH